MRRTLCLSLYLAYLAASVTGAVDRYHGAGEAWETAGAQRAADAREVTAEYWRELALRELDTLKTRGLSTPPAPAKNVVMFLGDGMSVPTLAAARTLLGQRQGQPGEEAQLSFEKFPTVGLTKTYCVNSQIPDSACTATSFLCGIKTNQGLLGVTANVTRGNCQASLDPATRVSSIAAWALQDGRDVGIVTTTRITHATPAGAYAQSANRNWESDADVRDAGHDPNVCPDIAHQLIHNYPANQFKVILGGGLREFIPSSTSTVFGSSGNRLDGRDLVEEWEADKRARNVSYAVAHNAAELAAAEEMGVEFVLGLFANTHMAYNMERPNTQPSLADMTAIAARLLSRNPRGYFLLVEGGRIDHAHHAVFPQLALDETIEMAKAVTALVELSSPDDTLVVVTSDHSHVMAYNGYSQRGRNILGASDSVDASGVPYVTLSYTNGPGFRPHLNGVRPNVVQDVNFGQPRWLAHVDVPLSSETHGGEDVAVFAWGVGHEAFTGLYEQHAIPHRMAWASCIGPDATVCSGAATVHPILGIFVGTLMALLIR